MCRVRVASGRGLSGLASAGARPWPGRPPCGALFGERAYAAAARRGVEQATETVVIGDGAEWIWNLATHHYAQATEIVD